MSPGQRIEQRRVEMKLTRAALGRQIGISSNAVAKIEDGRTKNTSYLVPIAKALNVSPVWLQYGKEADYSIGIELDEEESLLISNYRQLNEPERSFLLKCVKGLVSETFKKL